MKETAATNTKPRPPVIVVMGHVDHGKTTLLDYIRKTNVASREAGGITQAIAAYEIVHSGKKLTFIDTPGHEAFSKMRARGATAADLAVLVVAADEGVKPQTEESVRILNESRTPFVVAVTKTDKPGANVEKVKNDLAAAGVLLEGYGGQVSWQPVSAKTGEGVNELLDLLLLAAAVENLAYDEAASASGFVLEARKSAQRGVEVSVIVANGTLRPGVAISTETASGKVKILEDFAGRPALSLEPSAPALVIGFGNLPQIGELFTTGAAKAALAQARAAGPEAPSYATSDDTTLHIILKAADAGSLQALAEILQGMADLPAPKAGGEKNGGEARPLEVVSQGVGEVNDGDVKLAISVKGIVIGFKSKVGKAAATLAESHKVKIVVSGIIYELIKNIEDAVTKRQGAEGGGTLEVTMLFNQAKLGKQLVGGVVTEGVMRSKAACDIVRAQAVIARGKIISMRQGKSDTGEVPAGQEAGLLISAPAAIAVGDRILVK